MMNQLPSVRQQFPVFEREIHGKPLSYLDSAASTQKPKQVVEIVSDFYLKHYANVHRSIHTLGAEATAAYESSRKTVSQFINAASQRDIIFTSGTTQAINMVAHGITDIISSGDEILITHLEHHANIVPWQELCKRTGAKLVVANVLESGDVDQNDYLAKLGKQTKMVSLSHVSNALGTVNPVKEMVKAAKKHGALVLVDGAQAVAHMPVDVQALSCDFYVFSGHKIYGPSGIGVLYGQHKSLEKLKPMLTGGEMIREVTLQKTTFAELPNRLEAGTPNIVGAVGLAAAIDWLCQYSWDVIHQHEVELLSYATDQLKTVPGLKLIGEPVDRSGAISFVLEAAHAHDVATILDSFGVAVRAGHHCAMPLMHRFNVDATARASFAIYNNKHDVDALVDALKAVVRMFS